MPHELAFHGILLPALLPVFLASLLLMVLLDLAIGRAGLYRRVWHPSLFRLALFVCLFCSLALVSIR